jgi:hypothetical protein
VYLSVPLPLSIASAMWCMLSSKDFDGFGVLTTFDFDQYDYDVDGHISSYTDPLYISGPHRCSNVATRKGVTNGTSPVTGLPPGFYVAGSRNLVYVAATKPVTSVTLPLGSSFPKFISQMTIIPGN